MNLYQSKISFDKDRNFEKNTRTLDKIINLMNNNEETPFDDENAYLIEEELDNGETTNIQEKNFPKKMKPLLNGDKERIGKILIDEERGRQLNNVFHVSKFMDIHNCYKENYFTFDANTKRSSSLFLGGKIRDYSVTNIPFEKNFRIVKKNDKNQFTIKDKIFINNREVKMTNSIVFYLNNYYKKNEFFRFNTQISNVRPTTVINNFF